MEEATGSNPVWSTRLVFDSLRSFKLARGKPPQLSIIGTIFVAKTRRVFRAVRLRSPQAKKVEEQYNKLMCWVYMIKNRGDQLYVGVTSNPQQRLGEHNSKRGAEFTEHNTSYEIVFLEEYPTLAEARQREIQIKKWRREKKEMLIKRYQTGLPTKK